MHENSIGLQQRSKILIVCIGNDIAADDGAGFHVYNELNKSTIPANVTLLYLAVGGITLLDHLDGSEKAIIVIDAVKYGNKPGTVIRSKWDALPMQNHSPVSIHGIGLREVFEMVPFLYPGKLTNNIFFIGIEGEEFNQCDMSLTNFVAKGIKVVVKSVYETISIIQEEIQDATQSE